MNINEWKKVVFGPLKPSWICKGLKETLARDLTPYFFGSITTHTFKKKFLIYCIRQI